MNAKTLILALTYGGLSLMGQALPPELQGKFLKILLTTSNLPLEIGGEKAPEGASAQGINHNPTANVVWASTGAEAKSAGLAGKLVLVGDAALLRQGGCIAIITKNGKPHIIINLPNLTKCKVKVGDSVTKVAEINQ